VADGTPELRALFEQVGAALKQVERAGTVAQIAAARDLLAATRRQLYRILADDTEPARP
jgi:DNA-binding phage protein